MSSNQATAAGRNDSNAPDGGRIKPRALIKFLLPSLIGIGMFLIPFSTGDGINIGMGMLADGLKALLGAALPAIAVAVLCLSVILTALVKLTRPGWARDGAANELFDVEPLWFAMRVLGAAFALMTYFQVGPGFIIADFTGGVMLNDLAPVLLTFFFFAALLLPFLVDFGFMEFIGSLVRKPFRLIFGLPGRSAIDATASWMGSGTVGVLITTQQYEQGYYNRREASVIATNFSGPTSFMTDENAMPIRVEKQLPNLQAQPSREHLRELMRRVASRPDLCCYITFFSSTK